jgi:hypothetical protein
MSRPRVNGMQGERRMGVGGGFAHKGKEYTLFIRSDIQR